MGLTGLRLALGRHWRLASALLVVVLLNGVALSYLPARVYRGTATILATPAPTAQGGPVEAAAFEIPVVVETVRSSPFRTRVGDRLGQNPTDDSVSLSATWEPGTPIIRIQATGPEPELVATWANGAAEAIVDEKGTAPTVTTGAAPGASPAALLALEVLNPAGVPSGAVSPRPTILLTGALLLGCVLALLGALAAYRLTRRGDVAGDIMGRPTSDRHRRDATPGTWVLGAPTDGRRRASVATAPPRYEPSPSTPRPTARPSAKS